MSYVYIRHTNRRTEGGRSLTEVLLRPPFAEYKEVHQDKQLITTKMGTGYGFHGNDLSKELKVFIRFNYLLYFSIELIDFITLI